MKLFYLIFLMLLPVYGFTQTVRGNVRDTSNMPISGVSVQIVGTNKQTVTDSKGRFSLLVNDPNALIKFYLIGMESIVLKPIGDHPMNVVLISKKNSIDDVQVIAYGTTTQRNTVGSITKISGAQIAEQPITNPLAGLEGASPGLVVTSTSGVPGSSFNVQIRGQNTVNPNLVTNQVSPLDQPLFIVDGVPYAAQNSNVNQFNSLASPGASNVYHDQRGGISPFDGLNPADIESIEVLRDASATAIYGSRGGNGVIIITTKRGKSGKTDFALNVNDAESRMGYTMPMMNTQQYLQMRKQAFQNDGLTPDNVLYDDAYAPDLTVFDSTKYTNWKKYFLGNTAHNLNVSSSLSGGSANTQFRLSTGFNRDSYIFPGDYADNRVSFSANIHHNSTDQRFTMDFSTIYSYEKNNSSGDAGLLTEAYTLDPNYPTPVDNHGNIVWNYNGVPLDGSYAGYNPFAYLKELYSIQNTTLNTNLILGYKIADGLTFRTSLGYSTYMSSEYYGDPLAAQDPDYSPTATTRFGNNNFTTWIIEPQLEYKKSYKKLVYDILLGGTLEKKSEYSEEVDGSGYLNDALIHSISGSASQSASDIYDEYKYIALFGRVDLKWDSKYILDITGNRDGSSRFGPDRQFGNFGSVGGAWLFNEEKLVADLFPLLSYGKLRASYGLIGNDQTADYQYIQRWAPTTYNYLGSIGYTPQNLANPNFSWATTKKLEIGIELGVLKDRLIGGITWYRSRTDGQLINYFLPIQTGFSSVTENENALVQNTGFELTLQSSVLSAKKFSWRSSFNMTLPRNKLLAFPNLALSSYSTTYQIGKPLSEIYGFRYAGINRTDGLFQFYTSSGQITENPTLKGSGKFNDEVPIGNLDPKFYGGWQNSFTYSQFQLNILINYIKQLGENYLGAIYNYLPGNEINMPLTLTNAWRSAGQSTNLQILSSQYGNAANAASNLQQSNAIYSDASYIRIKTIAFSYSLPESLLRRLKLHGLKFNITGQNLFTITGYKGNDPETQSFYGIPPLKTISFGIQLTL